MNYKKIYDQLIEKAKPRGLDKSQLEGYHEIHHITPRCMGGSDEPDNLVAFTFREHFVAHLLLWKAYPDNIKLFHATWMMSNKKLTRCTSKVYQKLKEKHKETISQRSGKDSPNYKDLTGHRSGRLLVLEFSDWIPTTKGHRTSTWLCLCNCGQTKVVLGKSLKGSGATKSCGCWKDEVCSDLFGENNPFYGKKHSDESKEKMAKKKFGKKPSNTGIPCSEDTRRKISEAKAKNPTLWTEERKKLMSNKFKGKQPACLKNSQSVEARKKRKESLIALDRRPWEMKDLSKYPEAMKLWVNSDVLYSLWISNDNPAEHKLTRLVNSAFNVNYTISSFKAIVKKFKNGYVPELDQKWIDFNFKNREVTGIWTI